MFNNGLCVRYSAKFISFNYLLKEMEIIITILQIRKLRNRDVR